MKYAIASMALLVVAASASADIWLDWTAQDVGEGLTQYTFVIRNDDGQDLSYAATVAWEAAEEATYINQEYAGGFGADDEDEADDLVPLGFDKEKDTFSLRPFVKSGSAPGNSLLLGDTFSGYRQGPWFWEMSVGTGVGSQYGDNTPLAQVVADGDVHWIGVIARSNQLYTIEGITPEPATIALLGLGAAALLRRRRR